MNFELLTFVARRSLAMVPTLLLASAIIFFTLNVIPGGASAAALGLNPTEEARVAFEARHGLDRSLGVQYFSWLSGAISGDFGVSFQTSTSVSAEIGRRLPITLFLTLYAALIALGIAIPLAVMAARRAGKRTDLLASVASLIGLSIPNFISGTVLILVFGLWLPLFPVGGYVPPGEGVLLHLQSLAMPALALGSVSAALLMRILRSSLLDEATSEYVEAARSRGAGEWWILRNHIFRNASVPLITVGAMEFGVIFGGAVVIEKIFQIPGIGSYILMGIETRDFRVLQAGALTVTAFVLVMNLLVDLIAGLIDPRVRTQS